MDGLIHMAFERGHVGIRAEVSLNRGARLAGRSYIITRHTEAHADSNQTP